MVNVFVNSTPSDELLRERMYSGALVIYTPRTSVAALANHARRMIQEAFGNRDPRTAQFHMPVEKYVSIVAPLKPAFIHHPVTKTLIANLLLDFGCDPQKTYMDVPRLRMVTSDGYLTTGVGFAHHAHRDTWYSAPMQQLNWWFPLYEISEQNTIAFHPYYWDHPVKNSSNRFDYYEWNSLRKNVAQHVKADTRFQPKAEEPLDHAEPHIRTICEKDGIVVFAGAQLHSTIPNTSGVTRYSIDFRTVNYDDLLNRRAAPNLDSEPKGTSLRDFMRVSDQTRLSEEIIAMYETGNPDHGTLVFRPDAATEPAGRIAQ